MQSLSVNSTFKISIHGLYIAINTFTLPLEKLGGTKHHPDGRHHNHQHVKYLGWFKCSNTTHTPVYQPHAPAGANQPIYWFVEGEGLGMQQGTSIWVGSPKSTCTYSWESRVSKLCCCTAVAVVIIWSVFVHSNYALPGLNYKARPPRAGYSNVPAACLWTHFTVC